MGQNPWKIKTEIIRINIISAIRYPLYILKSRMGFKVIGFSKYDGLLITKFLKRYKNPVFYIGVTKTDKNLLSMNLLEIHESSSRIPSEDYVSIIFNAKDKQSKIIVGANLTDIIDKANKMKIEKKLEAKVLKNEIIVGLENTIRKISTLADN